MTQHSVSEKRPVLPFALMTGRGEAQEFPLEMTYAAILADIEKHRTKAGIIRKKEERIGFVSTVHWPILVVPWREGRYLVFDGMAVWSFVFEDHRIPSTEAFIRAVTTCKDYKGFIAVESSHTTYFRDFVDIERIPVMGLFIHEEFMKDLLSHIALAKSREAAYGSFLESRLPVAEAKASVTKLEKLISFGRKELEGLEKAKDELSEALETYREEINRVVDKTKDKYHQKIEAIRPDVTAKVAQLEKKRDEMWSMMQPRLLLLQGESRRLESEVTHWTTESKRKDVGPEAVTKARDRLAASKRDLDRARADVQKYQDEMSKARAGYDKQIQNQWERIRTLERERDAEVNKLLEDQRNMTTRASRLFQDMEGLRRRKEDEISFVESQGVQVPSFVGSEIVYMPLMICSLMGQKGMRYMVYPPMIAKTGKGVIGGIQSMFGGLVLPLEPKTKQFDETFRGGIERALIEDSSLATYIGSASMSANILHRNDLHFILAKGLAEMKSQGWIKDKHEKELLQSLQKHISTAASTAPPKGTG